MKCSLLILKWLQAYSIYVAVRSSKFPNRIPDLMGYQSLIIETHLECKNDCWIGYDCRFRQQAVSQPDRPWAAVEPTLWNLDKQRVPGASIVSVCLTSSPSVSCPPNPYQRHIKTLNVTSFASTGMRLQGPHVLILIANSCIFVIYVPATQQLPMYPTRQSTVHNRAASNQSGHCSLPKVPL